ncbi:MAG: A/G-specific adenine glycosylase [Caldilineaceae bacterium SB0675_bin_29]|uniref:Adenine DNA glycosylase n=1 Tax=Caldilineaceae bacterium SB0675_bin_29 TaxID=2605266 RepID=A0A6B1FSK3_9CHLR|nr:A/G-specific adenine glycosylase [Caldilineaceae bacterium SB0675_bin_29]
MHKQIADRLTAWQAQQLRELPWRRDPAGARDAYSVWVSEVMAQQTRLSVVEAYFNRWMEQFPTLEALASADQQEVLKLWEGLGYYSRARNLHRAAQIVVSEFGGQLPRTRAELLTLPGIGEYTAGAILSLAFGQHEPVLDGNAKRVISRLWDIETRIDLRSTENRLWRLSRKMVEAASAPGAMNEGLMELGALVCRRRNPLCHGCPVQSNCLAHGRGVEEERPVRAPGQKVPHLEFAAAIIWEDVPGQSRMLISQRPEPGLLGGLWSFPNGAKEADDEDLQACLRRAVRESLGVAVRVGERAETVEHTFTHFRMTLVAFHARITEGEPQAVGAADWCWTRLNEIEKFPCPVPDRKIIAALRKLAKESQAAT